LHRPVVRRNQSTAQPICFIKGSLCREQRGMGGLAVGLLAGLGQAP